MVKVKDRIMVCEDCFDYINDNLDSFVYYYGDNADEKINEIKKAVEALNAIPVTVGIEEEFSTFPCECCNSHLHGKRHAIDLLV